MKAILIHGMARSPLSFTLLAYRLRRAGLGVSTFGYFAALESFSRCTRRLAARIHSFARDDQYMLVGHSLGSIVIRGTLSQLSEKLPAACFFLAPPSQVSRAAKTFRKNFLFRAYTGEMGQLLSDPSFYSNLPLPPMPTTIYAGTRGINGNWSPFGTEPNDGVLTVAETKISDDYPMVYLPRVHTFIMNARQVADDIIDTARRLESGKTESAQP